MKAFTSFEIAPCVDAGDVTAYDTEAEQLEAFKVEEQEYREGFPEVSKFWTLYGFADDCLTMAIADRGTFEECAELYSRMTGNPAPENEGKRLVGLPAADMKSICETAAYLVTGMRETEAGYGFTCGNVLNVGDVSAVATLTAYAPELAREGDKLAASGELTGCFDYHVSQHFGRWWAIYVKDIKRVPSRQEAENRIADFIAAACV